MTKTVRDVLDDSASVISVIVHEFSKHKDFNKYLDELDKHYAEAESEINRIKRAEIVGEVVERCKAVSRTTTLNTGILTQMVLWSDIEQIASSIKDVKESK